MLKLTTLHSTIGLENHQSSWCTLYLFNSMLVIIRKQPNLKSQLSYFRIFSLDINFDFHRRPEFGRRN